VSSLKGSLQDELEPFKLYHVNLQSRDIEGQFDTYELGFLTQPYNYAYGAQIFDISVFDITDKNAKIRYSTFQPASCSVCYIKLCSFWDTKTVDHSFTFSNLEADTEYWVQILAKGEAVSDVFNFKTLKATNKVNM